MKPIKTPPVKSSLGKVKETFVEKVLALFEKYIDTTGAIMDDYVADRDMITELSAADDNFREDVKDLEVDLKTIIKELKDMSLSKAETEEVIDVLDEDYVTEWVNDKKESGCVVIRINNIADEMKLTEFLEKEIYPSYNEQRANMFL